MKLSATPAPKTPLAAEALPAEGLTDPVPLSTETHSPAIKYSHIKDAFATSPGAFWQVHKSGS